MCFKCRLSSWGWVDKDFKAMIDDTTIEFINKKMDKHLEAKFWYWKLKTLWSLIWFQIILIIYKNFAYSGQSSDQTNEKEEKKV